MLAATFRGRALTLWHWVQLTLSAGAAFEIARGANLLFVRAPCDARGLTPAIEIALRGGQRALASALAQACHPAWLAQAWTAGLGTPPSGSAPRKAVEEVHFDLVAQAAEGLRRLSSVARIASTLAFLAIVLELASAFNGGHGLLALQRGLVERLAVEGALLSFAIGLATSGACLGAAMPMRAHLRALSSDLHQLALRIGPAIHDEADM